MITAHFPPEDEALSASLRAQINAICAECDIEIRQWLPALEPDIALHCSISQRVIPSLGYGATSLDRHTIAFTLADAPAHAQQTIVAAHLRPTLFHECHHLVRGWVRQGGQRHPSFIHGVICEGLASAFERDAAGHAPPWCCYPPDVDAWVEELLDLPAHADYRHWMFLHPDGRRWIGYRAGTYIADRAIERSGLDAAQLVGEPCTRILRLADLPPPRHGVQTC